MTKLVAEIIYSPDDDGWYANVIDMDTMRTHSQLPAGSGAYYTRDNLLRVLKTLLPEAEIHDRN